MHTALKPDLKTRREHAGRLIQAVIDEELSAGYALTRWPETPEGTDPDPSIQAAYQALWHFESDEDRQRTELFYMDAQLELLSQLSKHLNRGLPLPPYFLNAYLNTYSAREHRVEYYHHASLIGMLVEGCEAFCRRVVAIAGGAFGDIRETLANKNTRPY